MSRVERAKGAAGEREVIAIFHAAGWPHAERSSNGRQQIGRGDMLGGPEGCHIEIKRQEKLNVPKALSQTIADAHPLDVPILIHRPSRHDWMATLPLDDLLDLLALRDI